MFVRAQFLFAVVPFALVATATSAALSFAAQPVLPRQKVAVQAAAPRHTLAASANFPDDSISIVTEGAAAVSGLDPDHIGELARAYATGGWQRVLPVAGLGPISNARDLMHMRGIDLAVIDSDIRAYARLDRSIPGTDTHLVQLLKLYDKTVYVVAPPDIRSLSDLAGQQVLALGEDSDGHVTARTLLGLLKINASVSSAEPEAAVAALNGNTAKALVLVAAPGDDPLARLPKDRGLHLLSIPASSALDAVYGRTTVPAAEAGALAGPEGIETLRVATVLATYNWRPYLYRYASVQQFIHALPQAIASLRTGQSATFWQSVDSLGQVRDWQFYDPALTDLRSIPPAVAPSPATATVAPAVASPAAPAAAPPAAVAVAPTTAPQPLIPGGIDVVVSPQPGLSDSSAASGGLLPEILAASLPGERLRLIWAIDPADALRKLEDGSGARFAIGWPRPDCGGGTPLGSFDQTLCDRFQFSGPVFKALDVFFVRKGSDFTFERDEQVAGHTACAAADMDIAPLDAPGRGWLKQEYLTLLRRPTVADCLGALDRGEVEAVFGDELSGEAALQSASLTDRIMVADRAVAVRELSVAAVKSDPNTAGLMAELDSGLAQIKSAGRYSQIVMTRLLPALSHTAVEASAKDAP